MKDPQIILALVVLVAALTALLWTGLPACKLGDSGIRIGHMLVAGCP